MPSLERALTRWLVIHRVGKTPDTRRYYWQTVKQIRRAWRPILGKAVVQVDADDVASFALRCGHYCASRWNGMLTVLYHTVPAARTLKRRPVKLTRKPPPNQQEFAALLREAAAPVFLKLWTQSNRNSSGTSRATCSAKMSNSKRRSTS